MDTSSISYQYSYSYNIHTFVIKLCVYAYWYYLLCVVCRLGFPKIEPEREMAPEEEMVMSYLLTQIEMELSLADDYDSISEATKTMAIELQTEIKAFDQKEKEVFIADIK